MTLDGAKLSHKVLVFTADAELHTDCMNMVITNLGSDSVSIKIGEKIGSYDEANAITLLSGDSVVFGIDNPLTVLKDTLKITHLATATTKRIEIVKVFVSLTEISI